MKLDIINRKGNAKIGRDTWIFNMTPAHLCPSKRLGFCKIEDGECYARRSEHRWPVVFNYRLRQYNYWKDTNITTKLNDLDNTLSRVRKEPDYFRINESGDFISWKCVSDIFTIAGMFKKIVFYMYTHRTDLLSEMKVNRPKNCIISLSNTKLDGFNCFNAVHKFSKDSLRCKADCRICTLCKKDHNKTVEVMYH